MSKSSSLMISKIGFGGGCHWCTEAVFQSLKGVMKVDQGWIQSDPPHDDYSEAVVVHYNPTIIPLKTLVEIHLLTHSSTSSHPMRKKYRSAVYFCDPSTKELIVQCLETLKLENQKEYITTALALINFKLNEEQFLDYYKRQPGAPFCRTYIDPKLKKLRERFGKVVV